MILETMIIVHYKDNVLFEIETLKSAVISDTILDISALWKRIVLNYTYFAFHKLVSRRGHSF